jgi:hypothetical protein
MNEDDLCYLRSILRQLREFSGIITYEPSISSEVLADNIDWLDCFIDKCETVKQKQKRNFDVTMRQRRAAIAAMRRQERN